MTRLGKILFSFPYYLMSIMSVWHNSRIPVSKTSLSSLREKIGDKMKKSQAFGLLPFIANRDTLSQSINTCACVSVIFFPYRNSSLHFTQKKPKGNSRNNSLMRKYFQFHCNVNFGIFSKFLKFFSFLRNFIFLKFRIWFVSDK